MYDALKSSYSLTTVIPPYAEPVHYVDMKNHLKASTDITDDDALIASQIVAARDKTETETGTNCSRNKVMLATTFDFGLSTFPWWSEDLYVRLYNAPPIGLPRVPVVSITSITYVDNAGVTQTLSSSLYSIVDAARGIIALNYNEAWPSVRFQPNAVMIRFVAGMAAPFTAVATTDILSVLGRSFTVADRVRLLNSGGSLPGGLMADTDYFVIAGPKLSLTSGGSAVDITSVGSGTHFIATDLAGFETLRNAIKVLVGHWYMNREAVLVTGANPLVLPLAFEALVASQHA